MKEKETAALPAKEEILKEEDSLLNGLLAAAEYKEESTLVEIRRAKGSVLFTFHIRPLGEDELMDCRKQATKMIPNPSGRHLPKIEGELNVASLRCRKIFTATTEADREKIWNNAVIKQKLNCLSALDVIDAVLMAGEKDSICELIDEISGYGSQVTSEDYAKN